MLRIVFKIFPKEKFEILMKAFKLKISINNKRHLMESIASGSRDVGKHRVPPIAF